MQRRAAAIYVVFFVVVAIVAFSLTTVAEEPSVSVEGRNFSQGQTVRAGGTAWTVNVSGGSGELSTVNESARFTASLANNSSVLFRDGAYVPVPNGSGGTGTGTGSASPARTAAGTSTPGSMGTSVPTAESDGSRTAGTRFRVLIANTSAGNTSGGNATGGNASGGNASNVSSFTLRQQFDTTARLRADPAVADTVLTATNGTQYVRYRNETSGRLDAYLPTPEVRNVSVGDSFPYQNNSTTVDSVNTTGASLVWRGELKRTQELEEGENVTLGGTTHIAHFPTNGTVTLSQNVAAYQEEEGTVERFHERILGLWGIVIISLFAAIIIAGLAYMPVRG